MRIALAQPGIITDTSFACTAAQVCSEWRQAVLQGPKYSTAVSVKDSSWPQLQSLYHWLQRHSRLVDSLTCTFRGLDHPVLEQQQQQSCSHGRNVQGSLLASDYSEYIQGGLQILGLLAGMGLVELNVVFDVTRSGRPFSTEGHDLQGPALAGKLARLQGLQRLTLHGAVGHIPVPGSCLSGLAQLTRLTSLKITGSWSDGLKPLQQLLAQQLPLQ
jgi:hypothetical protein